MADIYTGEHARIWIGSQDQSAFGMGSFTLTVNRDITEQPLVGEKGPFRTAGILTIEGSLTQTKFTGDLVSSITEGDVISISGTSVYGTDNGPSFYFASAMITRWELSEGDASSIVNASVDFVVLDAYNANSSWCWVSGTRKI